jgi:hypothetical protein
MKDPRTKDKLIDLFLRTIEDEEFDIEQHPGNLTYQRRDNNRCYFMLSNGVSSSTLVYTNLDGSSISASQKKKYNYDFKENFVGLNTRTAWVTFDSWPELKITGATTMVEHDTRVIKIRRKGVLGLFMSKKIQKHSYKKTVKPEDVYIEFGPLRFLLSENEFNMIYNAIVRERDKRLNIEAYEKLDERLSKYYGDEEN